MFLCMNVCKFVGFYVCVSVCVFLSLCVCIFVLFCDCVFVFCMLTSLKFVRFCVFHICELLCGCLFFVFVCLHVCLLVFLTLWPLGGADE